MSTQSQSNYKPLAELHGEIENFLAGHQITLRTYSSKISELFECACFNYIIQYFVLNKFSIKFQNLSDNNVFRYKVRPAGYPHNFSYVTVEKAYRGKNRQHLDIASNRMSMSSPTVTMMYTILPIS